MKKIKKIFFFFTLYLKVLIPRLKEIIKYLSIFLSNIHFCKFFKNILSKTIESVIILMLVYYLVSFSYKVLIGVSVNRFTDEQISSFIQRNIDNENFSYTYANFNHLNDKKSIVVLGESSFDFSTYYSDPTYDYKDMTHPSIYVFEVATKSPLEQLIFKADIYDLKYKQVLLPKIPAEGGGSIEEYAISASRIRSIDIFNDGKEEVFFCLDGIGGSGYPSYCSIYNGKNYITPFPIEYDTYFNYDEIDGGSEGASIRHYYYGDTFDAPLVSDKPIYSGFGSDDFYYFDDKNDRFYFLNMIWGDNESHADAHDYDVLEYSLLEPSSYFYNIPGFFIFNKEAEYISTKENKLTPQDVMIKLVNGLKLRKN